MARSLWIIADDYGLGEKHDEVIRELLQTRALHGTSVLVETCDASSARALADLWTSGVRVGLHLNLTWPASPQERRPGRMALLARGMLGLGGEAAARAVRSQWQRFEDLFGRPPDYIDGHEHCHSFPTIRPAVLEFAVIHDVPVRSMVPLAPPQGTKAKVIAALGRAVQREAQASGLRTNGRFGGVLPIDRPDLAIRALADEISLGRELAGRSDGETWIMTHPGSAEDPIQIPGHPARLRAMEARLLAEMNG